MVILTWILGIVGTLGVAGTIAAVVFFPAVAVPIAERILQVLFGCKPCVLVVAFLVVALGSFWYGRAGQYERGHAAAIAEIAAEDSKTIARALEKREQWKNCREVLGGKWDQTTGRCRS
ncbi:hypothetical protein ACRAVF_18900 [Bradyrhizobium oligotrophicum S58]